MIQQPPDDAMSQWLSENYGVEPDQGAGAQQGADIPRIAPDDFPLPTRARPKTYKPKHLWEEAADEVIEWLEWATEAVADALMFHGRSPFAADLTEAEKLEYYAEVMQDPAKRAALLQRVGIDQYIRVIAAIQESAPGRLPAAPREVERRMAEAPEYTRRSRA